MERWMFGEKADELLDKVISNTKTATSSLYNGQLPNIGSISIIVNSLNQDRCKIQLTDYKVLKYKDMTEELALLEGEGSLKEWQDIHKSFFSKELKINKENFDENIEILFEVFKVIEILD